MNSCFSSLFDEVLGVVAMSDIHGNHVPMSNYLKELVIQSYDGPLRFYHNIEHIVDLGLKLSHFNLSKEDRRPILLAILFHDIVYDSKGRDNEEKSNELFLKYFSSDADAPLVSEMILASKNHQKSDKELVNIFLDLDLSILGANPTDFNNYSAKIRKEYHFVPEDIFMVKRAEVLKSLNFNYYTLTGKILWGSSRKKNLST